MYEDHVAPNPVAAIAERKQRCPSEHPGRPAHACATRDGGCQAYGAVEAARLVLATLGRRHGPMA